VYTREAHPAEHRPAHVLFEDKLSAAARLRDEIGISRPILVDDFDGPVHLAYGGLPNMSWVLGRGGLILYKAMWTSAARVGDFLERFEGRPLDSCMLRSSRSSSRFAAETRRSSPAVSSETGTAPWPSSRVPMSSGASEHGRADRRRAERGGHGPCAGPSPRDDICLPRARGQVLADNAAAPGRRRTGCPRSTR